MSTKVISFFGATNSQPSFDKGSLTNWIFGPKSKLRYNVRIYVCYVPSTIIFNDVFHGHFVRALRCTRGRSTRISLAHWGHRRIGTISASLRSLRQQVRFLRLDSKARAHLYMFGHFGGHGRNFPVPNHRLPVWIENLGSLKCRHWPVHAGDFITEGRTVGGNSGAV